MDLAVGSGSTADPPVLQEGDSRYSPTDELAPNSEGRPPGTTMSDINEAPDPPGPSTAVLVSTSLRSAQLQPIHIPSRLSLNSNRGSRASRSEMEMEILGAMPQLPPAVERRSVLVTSRQEFGRQWAQVWRQLFSSEGREFRQQFGIIFRLLFASSQVVVIVIFLPLSATKLRAHGTPDISEWTACSKPLGAWSALWAVRGVFSVLMNVWEWRRYMAKRRRLHDRPADLEGADANIDLPEAAYGGIDYATTEIRSQPRQPPSATWEAARPNAIAELPRAALPPATPRRSTPATQSTPQTPRPRRQQSSRSAQTQTQSSRGSDAYFDRFDTLLTALALVHFIGNHVLLYSSVWTCRLTSPHVWWLAFSIACLGYIIVVELLLIAFVVFILGPLLILFLNLLMMCFGRPVDRNGNVQLRPEIPKLDQKWIDMIPLVVYIPPRSEDTNDSKKKDEPLTESPTKMDQNPPFGPHSERRGPPANATSDSTVVPSERSTSRRQSSMFSFIKRKSTRATSMAPDSVATQGTDDTRFEKAEHPFVVLPGNRATCPICLTDFVEPKRKDGKPMEPAPAQIPVEEIEVKSSKEPAAEATEQEETGTPGEPLRLLECGHVFHKQCLDPWLNTVSGRCPVCSRKVDYQHKDDKQKQRQR